MPGTELYLLRKRLEPEGFVTRQFSYRSVAESLNDNAARLARFLAEVPGERVHLVGHSLGGVVLLRMLEREPPARDGRVVCLASPLRGSRAARALADWPAGGRLLGKSSVYFLDEQGLPPWSGGRQLGIIAGDVPMGLGHLFGKVPAPHDGTIAVEETRLAGATDHIVLPVSHLSVLLSRSAADQVLHFLQHGVFDHESRDKEANS